jgi:hypothetical protein
MNAAGGEPDSQAAPALEGSFNTEEEVASFPLEMECAGSRCASKSCACMVTHQVTPGLEREPA